jgi:protoporphyrinogen/coproporphyrinogen III oxidase
LTGTGETRSNDPARRLVVIGGGISGLAAAWSAHRTLEGHRAIEAHRTIENSPAVGPRTEVLLLEAEDAVGGKVRSVVRDDWLVEHGPTGYLDNEAAVDRLVAAAGIDRIPANAAAARRFLVRGGALREIVPHPLRFARSGLLSPLGLLRLAGETFLPRRSDGADESVWEFARRRLGREVADRLIAPMVLGVFAGDARRISLRSAFPRMRELEEEYGSLIRALIHLQRRGSSGGPAGPAGVLTSFAGGLQALPHALATRAPFPIRTSARVEGIHPGERGGWRIAVAGDGEAVPADAVVLACEAWRARPLLLPFAPSLARALEPIPHPPVIVAALGFGAEARARTPHGFGALIARPEGFRILGVLWDTHLFAGRSPDGHILMRAMLGGAVDSEAAALDDAQVLQAVRGDLRRLLGIEEPPLFSEIVRWPRAIPQYEIGHGDRVAEAESALAELSARHPGLELAGNYLHGIAFGKAARAGEEAGVRAARTLGASPPPQ